MVVVFQISDFAIVGYCGIVGLRILLLFFKT
jgi:hypothetical protein